MQETENIEFKREWKDDFLKVICAFANAQGGILYIGKDDDGNDIGIQNHKELLEVLPNKIVARLGIITNVQFHGDTDASIAIKVSPSSVPVSYQGRYYMRSGSVVLELQGKQLSDFLLKKAGMTWDAVAMDNARVEEINAETIAQFKVYAADRLPLIDKERDVKVLLEKLNLSEHGVLKRAAILLFGNHVQRIFPQAHLRIGRFISETEIIGSDLVEGNLFQQVEGAFEILRKKYLINKFRLEGIHRREQPDYPLEALREALINALIHRNYNSTASIQIRVYDNKLMILNDGLLPEGLTVDDLKKPHLSVPRNFLLCDIFYKAGMIESWGSGTLKVVSLCRGAGLPELSLKPQRAYFQSPFIVRSPIRSPVRSPIRSPITKGIF
jgi:ATP-dependent DNA helicase RecG